MSYNPSAISRVTYDRIGFPQQCAMHGVDFGSSHRDGFGFDRLFDQFLSLQMTFDVVNASDYKWLWSA